MKYPFYVKFLRRFLKDNQINDLILIEQNKKSILENTSYYRFRFDFLKNFDEHNEINHIISKCNDLIKIMINDIENNFGIINASTINIIEESVKKNDLYIDEIINKILVKFEINNIIHVRDINIIINQIFNEEIKKYLRNIIALNITHEFEIFYALPIEFYFKGKNNGNFIIWLFLNDPKNEEELENYILDELKPFMSLVASNIAIWDFNELQRKSLIEPSIKSAIAAIMARNGSHNIGSHILSSVGNNYNELPDDQFLYKYIQDRMDYIAQITTEFPTWSYPVWLVRDLMRNFYMQHHLQNYIARSEGLSAFCYQEDRKQQNSIIIKIKRAGEEDYIIAPGSDNTSFDQDIAIAIPGGIVGQQAFYTILENIIRNSAKHNWAEQSQEKKEELKNLEITVEFDEQSDSDFVIFRAWDNVSNIFYNEQISEDDIRLKRLPIEEGNEKVITDDFSKCHLHQAMNSRLSQSFIDQSTGQLIKANWGLAEMKISAGFLNKKDTSIIGSNEIKDILFDHSDQGYTGIISAVPVREKIEKDGTEKKATYRFHLGYQFAVPKPKEVLICGQFPSIENTNEYNQNSIYFQEDCSQKNLDYEYIVLYDDENLNFINQLKQYQEQNVEHLDKLYQDIKNEIENFPYRLFIVSDDIKNLMSIYTVSTPDFHYDFLFKRIVILTKDEFTKNLNTSPKHFKLHLYARWIEHLKKMQGIADKELKMILNVEGNNRHNNKQKVYRLLFDKFKEEILNDSECEQDVKRELAAVSISALDKYDDERRKRKQPAPYDSIESLIDKWIDLTIYEFEREEATNRLIFNEEVNDFNVKPRVSDALRDKIDGWAEHLKDIARSYYKIIKKVYIRYEEETPTLPPIYRADKSVNTTIRLDKAINELVKVTITNNTYDERYDIAYDRHTLMTKQLYSEALSGSQTYFSILNHLPNDDYLKQKIGLQLVENALLRMVVIDERVAQYLNQFKYTIKERYDGANIEIPCRVKTLEGESPWIDLIQNLAKDAAAFDLENIEADKFDVMIIHQGILDKVMKNPTKEKLSILLKNIKEKIPFVIITSGRGEPENIPVDAKFLAFSNIETFLLKDYPEKFLLSQIAMKITSIKRQ